MNRTERIVVLSICLIAGTYALSARVNGGRAADERDVRPEREEFSFFNDKKSLITPDSEEITDETMDNVSVPDTATLSAINKHLKDLDAEMGDTQMILKVLNRKVEKTNLATKKLKEQVKKITSK